MIVEERDLKEFITNDVFEIIEINEEKEILKIISEKMKYIYGDNCEKRHLYSTVSRILIHSNFEKMKLDVYIISLNRIIKKIISTSINTEEYKIYLIKFLKLSDHIILELNRIVENNNQLNDFLKQNENIKKEFEETSSKLEFLEEKLESYKFDIIGLITGVLSLFAIFGANYTVVNGYLKEISNYSDVIKFLFLFNVMLLSVILFFIILLKYIFTVRDFHIFSLNKTKNKLNNGEINIVLVIIIMVLLCFVFIIA